MAHRIEVELTSQTGDSTWTWRAAGAKQPRGTVGADLVPAGAAVGTVLRAEVETTLDGTTVTALLPARAKGDARAKDRIEVIGTPQRAPDVNVVLASKGRRRRDDRPDGPSQEGRRPAERKPRSEDRSRGPRSGSGNATEPPRKRRRRVAYRGANGTGLPVRAPANRGAARTRAVRLRRPPTAMPPWRRSGPSRSRWPNNCCAEASRPFARPSRSRTPVPVPRVDPRSHRVHCWPWPRSCVR